LIAMDAAASVKILNTSYRPQLNSFVTHTTYILQHLLVG
jgi:hypothetical protein